MQSSPDTSRRVPHAPAAAPGGDPAPPPTGPTADPRRWKALAVLALIQFMLVLDITVVNVALPRIQHDLVFSRAGLAWVVNGYVLAAGGLLLLAGRSADLLGRRRLFLIGVAVFALASALCGAAVAPGMLVGARFLQGAGEAMAAPASLGLIALLFPDPAERMKALGIWGGIAGLGGTSGTVISGALTDLASWRWIFFVNLPVALFALLAVPRLVSESRMTRGARRPRVAGALIGTAGLVAVVDGLLGAATHPWGSTNVLVPLLVGAALLVAMVRTEARSGAPLIPLEFFTNRTRVVTNFVTLFFSASFFSYFFLLTLFEQQVRGYSPLRGGLSYLPFGISISAGIGLSTALMPRLGARAMLGTGFLGCAVGLALTSGIGPASSYGSGILPGMIVLGLFSGICFPAIGNSALHGVTGEDSSLASGVQSAMQQIGGAVGLACLVTLALRHAAGQVQQGIPAGAAAVHGYVLAFRIGTVLLVAGGLLVFCLLERVVVLARPDELTGPGPAALGDALAIERPAVPAPAR